MSPIERLELALAPPQVSDGTVWHDIRTLGVEGCGWPVAQCPRPFHRLPSRAKGIVDDAVWSFSHHSTGMYVRFVTDAHEIAVRWTLLKAKYFMPHMAPTGHSGLDLYGRYENKWRHIGIACPEGVAADQESIIINRLMPQACEYMLYLPLYNGVEQVKVGIPMDATIKLAPSWPRVDPKPMCFYGTSIVHGGCATRPGMTYPAILSRWLDHPFLNFGFSGNGKCTSEDALYLSELSPCVYILDPLPNLQQEEIEQNCERFIRILHDARPKTPIVMIENITYPNCVFVVEREGQYLRSNQCWRRVFNDLKTSGFDQLHYVSGTDLLGHDGEATVDGTHLTDLGFYRFSKVLGPILRPLIPGAPDESLKHVRTLFL